MMSEVDEKIKEGLDMAFGKGLKAGGLMLAGAIKHMIKMGTTIECMNVFTAEQKQCIGKRIFLLKITASREKE